MNKQHLASQHSSNFYDAFRRLLEDLGAGGRLGAGLLLLAGFSSFTAGTFLSLPLPFAGGVACRGGDSPPAVHPPPTPFSSGHVRRLWPGSPHSLQWTMRILRAPPPLEAFEGDTPGSHPSSSENSPS